MLYCLKSPTCILCLDDIANMSWTPQMHLVNDVQSTTENMKRKKEDENTIETQICVLGIARFESYQSGIENASQIWSLVNRSSDYIIISHWCGLGWRMSMLFSYNIQYWILNVEQNIFNSHHITRIHI